MFEAAKKNDPAYYVRLGDPPIYNSDPKNSSRSTTIFSDRAPFKCELR
jgi:hypothetical protein